MRFPGLIALVGLALISGPARAQAPAPSPQPKTFGVSIQEGGVLCEEVDAGSVAGRAGLRAGDVLVGLGDARPSDLDAVRAWLAEADPEAEHRIAASRGPAWNETVEAAFRFEDGRRFLGIVPADGLRVIRVKEGSVAAEAGVRGGDFLLSFGSVVGPDYATLKAAIETVHRDGVPVVPVRVWREGRVEELRARFHPDRRAPIRIRPVPGLPSRPAVPPVVGRPQVILPGIGQVGGMVEDLDRAIAILETKQGQDPELAEALARVRSARKRAEPLASGAIRIQGMMKDADEALEQAFRFGERMRTDMVDGERVEILIERLGEMIDEGVDREAIRDAIRREFDVLLEFLDDKGRPVAPPAESAPEGAPTPRAPAGRDG